MLVAMGAMSLMSCTDTNNASTNTDAGNDTKVEATADANVAPEPTGDAEKDAQAYVDYMVKTIEAADLTKEGEQTKIDEMINTLQEKFETYYKDKGEEAYKAFDEAGRQASQKADLEGLMAKKAMEALKAAGLETDAATAD